jgi:Secretion system C-terminal sorting domain
MNECYPKYLLYPVLIALSLLINSRNSAQCTCSDGSPAKTDIKNVTIVFPSNSTKKITMPQFSPATGTLVCVDAKIFLTSVATLNLENDDVMPIDYMAYYSRKDTFTGPGIGAPITGAVTKGYGPYHLAASDGVYKGPDFVTIGPDTVYNKLLYQLSTTNTVNYLGGGTVDFYYTSSVFAYAVGSDYYSLGVASKNSLDFRLTYSYCNNIILKNNFRNFQVAKISSNDVALSWNVQNEIQNSNYEIQFSENAQDFEDIGTTTAGSAAGAEAKYQFKHHFDKPLSGKLFFRIKQGTGQSARFSEIKAISSEGESFPLKVFPNPVVRNINMELSEPVSGNLTVELISVTGQVLQTNKVVANSTTHLQMTIENSPPAGFYYLKAHNETTRKVYSGKVLFSR